MRTFLTISLFAILVAPALAQNRRLLPDEMVQQLCHAAQVTNHPITSDRVHHIRKLIARAASCREHADTCRGS
jgi:hypothetical protein